MNLSNEISEFSSAVVSSKILNLEKVRWKI